MTQQKRCNKCNQSFDQTKEYFGHTPAGNFRGTCRGCIRKNVATHSKENPDMVANRQLDRKEAQKHAARFKNYDPDSLKKLLHREQQDACYYRKKKISLASSELEHKTPIAKGGRDTKDNIAASCYQCNKEKHNKTVAEYREWRIKNGYEVLF